ncbi:uncharacterized protein LOC129578445 [Sitodiplosis mosellana]|uniref:uncharacterized protein LOC129578445 n=1 Tax=Sitodiplosis mosellana TaxID=263140 RepID=UPI002443F7A1|nr:uncharacterized protein LOC129578445 [Sitodiplosis mosellana]
MDIPETGAVFTLGKSYLSENHQSYFFIKNDPIRKVIAGENQSAVICESGRLFIWGENQWNQLSAGSKEVIAKPSCVKEIKNLGYKVRNIAFGQAFSVILTENNKVFFNGKSIFTINETFGSKFRSLDNNVHCIIRHNYEIIDFHKRCLDDHGNLDDLVDISAHILGTYFVVLTNSGKLYSYGYFGSAVKRPSETVRRISENFVTRIAKCGRTFVVFVTDCNGVYVLGKLNSVEYSRVTKLNTSDLKDTVYSIYVSQKDEIFLISSSGDVYKSTSATEIQFERIILFNQNDNIWKFCSGHDFVCVLTDKNKFLTTFNEKLSAKHKGIRLPHELKKFQNLRILDIAAGLHHILLFAVSKLSPSTSLDITSSDANENIPIQTLPKSYDSTKSVENQKRSIELLHQNTPDFKNIISSKPILAKETLEEIHSDARIDISDSINQTIVSKAYTQPNTLEADKKITAIEVVKSQTELSHSKDDVQENHSKISDKVEIKMDIVSKSVSNIGDSLMNDIKSVATTGEEKLKDLAEETEKTVKEVPKNVIDYVKTSMGLEKEEEKNKNVDDTNMNKVIGNTGEESTNEISSDPPIQNSNEPDNNEMNKQNNKLNRALAQDVTVFDELKDDTEADNEVKFINDGVDVGSTSNIIQAMNDEINEMSNNPKNKSDELTMKFDELAETTEADSNKIFQIKNVEKDIMKDVPATTANLMTKIIPLKHDLDEVDLEADVDTELTEQTTASIKSVSTPAKNQFEMNATVEEIEATTPKESEGRVKRFFNEIKNNCKTSDTVVEMEENAMQQVQQIKNHSLDIIGDNKTSKVCTIL